MSNNWNVVKPACCARWLVLPTVYSDALSYGEQLDKFCYLLNQVIQNNNILPDFIADMIKEYINSGAIGEVVRDILADYILNVKYPPEGITPAVGDGSADDTEAIQGCIDYAAANGGVVYFPYGAYLTQPLTMKDEVSLFGFDRYSTRIVLKAGATNALINGEASNFSIINLTLDGNSGVQVNDVNVALLTGANVLFDNCIVEDGYTLLDFNGNGGHLQLNNIVFGNAVEKSLVVSGNVMAQAENVLFNQLSAVGGVYVVDISANAGLYRFKSVAKCNVCVNVSGNNNDIYAMIENATTPVNDAGLNNNIVISGITSHTNFTGDVSNSVGGDYSVDVNADTTLNHDKNVDVTIGGNETKTVAGESDITLNGKTTIKGSDISTTLTGDSALNAKNLTETLTGNKKLTGVNSDEKLSGTKTLKANSLEEDITGDKVVSAENISENVNDKTVTSENVTEINAGDYFLDTVNPIKYGTVTKLNESFGTVPWRDKNGNDYNVLTQGNTEMLYGSLIDVRQFGAKGDGVTDDTAAIQAAIDWCVTQKKGYSVIISGGIYLISNTINLWYDYNTSLIIQGAIVRATTEMDFMISVGYRKTSAWTGYFPYGVFGQGTLDCNHLAGGIVMNPERVYTHIENIQIRNCEKVGISNGLSTDTTVYSSQYTIFNVGIYGNGETNAGNGIEDYHGDGYISNCFIYYKRIGIKSRAATYINNIHIWGGDGTFVGKPYEQEIMGVWAGSSVYLSDMYFDSTPIGVYLSDGCECQCSNIMLMSEYDFTMTCFNANYDCAITVDALNIQNFNVTTFNPLYLRNRPSANYFIGLKRFRCTITEKLSINYKEIVFNEFNNLVVNPFVTTLERNYSPLSAGYTLIGYVNSMRSRLNLIIELASMSYFDFSVNVQTNGSVSILKNDSVKYADEDIEIVFGQLVTNDYGNYIPVYVHANAKSTSSTVVTSVIVNGTQNAGFYPITTGALDGKTVVPSVDSILTVQVPTPEEST